MITLDVSAAVHRRAGLGRYAESLARALVARHPERYGLFYNREHGIEPLVGLESLPACTVALGYKPWRLLVWWAQLARIGFDRLVPGTELFHATEHLLLPLRSIPTVLTVHDLIFRHLPTYHKPLNRWYLRLALPLYCQRATHIIAISECTRRDLVRSYGLPDDKISVVHEAAAPHFRPQALATVEAVRERYGLPERYLLFVGTIEPRKNLNRLLAAFEVLYKSRLSGGLVIVGRPGWLYDDFFAALERSPVRHVVLFTGYVPDADLPGIYAGAQALVMPSLYEGFGLPVLEAMACGTPVLCSMVSALPEVAGEAALYFDPFSTEALIEQARRLLSDATLREEMAQRGQERAQCFSWERVASQTESVYMRVLEGGGGAGVASCLG